MTDLDRVLEGIERIDTKVEKLDVKTGEFQLTAVQRLARMEEKLGAHPDPAVCSKNFARLDQKTKESIHIAKDAQKEARKAAGIVATAVAGVVSAAAGAWSYIKGGQ